MFNIRLFFFPGCGNESAGGKRAGSLRMVARIHNLSSRGLPPRKSGPDLISRAREEALFPADDSISYLADLYLSPLAPSANSRPLSVGKQNYEDWEYFSST